MFRMLLMFICFLFSSCMFVPTHNCTINKKNLSINNPVQYTYFSNIDSLYNKLESIKYRSILEGDLYNKDSYIFWSTLKDSVFYKDFLLLDACKLSKMYFCEEEGTPLTFCADYHIQLIPIDSTRTTILIKAFDSIVSVGLPSLRIFGHTPREVVQGVEPSSIEEYEILLRIGELIGEKNMPEVLVPKDYQTKESSLSKKVHHP